MRKLKFPLLAAVALVAFTFTSCDKDDDPDYKLNIVGFETASLNDNGYLVNNTYSEAGMTFSHSYTATETGFYWSGFAVSDNHDKESAGNGNQFSVYNVGGAGGSSKFGIASLYGAAEMSFAQGKACEIEYAYINNSTYAVLSMLNGDDFAKKFSADDWFLLTITGYDADGEETESVDVDLANYKDGKNFVMSDWTKVDLTPLGKVNKVGFTLSSSDTGQYGMNTPAYFCIDNIAYREYVTE